MTDTTVTPTTDAQQGIASIAKALASAQSEMGKALKSANNPHFNRKYADLSSVVDACMPALNAAGIAVIQPTGEDSMGMFVETMLIHGESGEMLKCRVPLIIGKKDMQGYGSAVTYARRYGLMSMSGVAPEDDDGSAAVKAAPQTQPPKLVEVTAETINAFKEMLINADDMADLQRIWGNVPDDVRKVQAVEHAKDCRKGELSASDDARKAALQSEGAQ